MARNNAASGFGGPAIDMKTAVREQVNAWEAGAYFKLFAQLRRDNPPAKEDSPILRAHRADRHRAGQHFDIAKLDPAVAQGLQNVPKLGVEKIMAHFKTAGKSKRVDLFDATGVYGTDYLQRRSSTPSV